MADIRHMRRTLVALFLLLAIAPARAASGVKPPAEANDAPAYWLRASVANGITPATQPQQDDLIDTALPLVAVGQIRVGDLSGARQTALIVQQRADRQNVPALRALAYCELASLQWELMQPIEYRKSLAEARKASSAMDKDFLRPMVDLRLATLMDRAGTDGDADDVPRQTRDLERKASLYCALALEAGARKDVPLLSKRLMRAAATAEGQDDALSSRILSRVGRAYAQLGDFDSARITIANIAEPESRADVYGALARQQIKAHDPRGYRDSIAKACDAIATLPPADRAWRYVLLAYEQQDAGDRDGMRLTLHMAGTSIQHIDDATQRAKAYFDLAIALGRLGDVNVCMEALTKAETALAEAPPVQRGELDPRSGRYSDVACALAKAGKIESAERVIQRIIAGDDRSVANAALAVAEADAGRLASARDLLEGVQMPAARCRLCRRIGESFSHQSEFDHLQAWIATLSTPCDRAYATLGAAEGLLDRRVIDLTPAEVSQVIDP